MADFNPLDLLAAAAELKRPNVEIQSENENDSETEVENSGVEDKKNVESLERLNSIGDGTVVGSVSSTVSSSSMSVSIPIVTSAHRTEHSKAGNPSLSKTVPAKPPVVANSHPEKSVAKVFLNPTTGQRFHVLNVQSGTTDPKVMHSLVSSSSAHNSAGSVSMPLSSLVNTSTSITTNSLQTTYVKTSAGSKVVTLVNPKSVKSPALSKVSANGAEKTGSQKPPYMMIRLPAGLSPDVKAATLKSLIPSALLAKGYKVTTMAVNSNSSSTAHGLKASMPVTPVSVSSLSNVAEAKCTVSSASTTVGSLGGATGPKLSVLTAPVSAGPLTSVSAQNVTIPATRSSVDSAGDVNGETVSESCAGAVSISEQKVTVPFTHLSGSTISDVSGLVTSVPTPPVSVVSRSDVTGQKASLSVSAGAQKDATEQKVSVPTSLETVQPGDTSRVSHGVLASPGLKQQMVASGPRIVTSTSSAVENILKSNDTKDASSSTGDVVSHKMDSTRVSDSCDLNRRGSSETQSVASLSVCEREKVQLINGITGKLDSNQNAIVLASSRGAPVLPTQLSFSQSVAGSAAADAHIMKKDLHSAVSDAILVSKLGRDFLAKEALKDVVSQNQVSRSLTVSALKEPECVPNVVEPAKTPSIVNPADIHVMPTRGPTTPTGGADVLTMPKPAPTGVGSICGVTGGVTRAEPKSNVTETNSAKSSLQQRSLASPGGKGMTAVVTGFGFPSRLVIKTDHETRPDLHSTLLSPVPLSNLKYRDEKTPDFKSTTIVNPVYDYGNLKPGPKLQSVSKYVDSYGSYVKAGQRLPDIKIPVGAKIDHPLRDHDYCYHVFYELAINSHLPEKVKKPRERKRKSTEKAERDTAQEPKPAKRKYVRKNKSAVPEQDVSKKIEDHAGTVKQETASDEEASLDSSDGPLPKLELLMHGAKIKSDRRTPDPEPRKKRKYVRRNVKTEEEIFETDSEPVKISGSDNFQDQFIYFATKRLKSRTRDLSKKAKPSQTTPWPYGNDPVGPSIPLGPYASIGGLPSRTPPHPNQAMSSSPSANQNGSERIAQDVHSMPDDLGQLAASMLDFNGEGLRSGQDDKQSIEDLVMNMTTEQIEAVVNLMSKDINRKLMDNNVDSAIDGSKLNYSGDDEFAEDGPDSEVSYPAESDSLYSPDQCKVPKLAQLALNALPTSDQSATNPSVPSHSDGPPEDVLSLVSESVTTSSGNFAIPSTVEDFDDLAQINITPMESANTEFPSINTSSAADGLFDLDDNLLTTSVANMSMLFDSEFTTSPLGKPLVSTADSTVSTSSLLSPERSSIPQPVASALDAPGFSPVRTASSSRVNLFPETNSYEALSCPTRDYSDVESSAPELTTVSMYWNTFPALVIKGTQCIRLVDIHKQALPAKDTGLLKKRCQTMGLPIMNCTELQRDFLIRYAFASPSRSTIIVSKDVAQTLISSYVNPVSKAASKRKESANTEEEKSTSVESEPKDSVMVSSGGYMTPDSEDLVATDTRRDLLKSMEGTQESDRKLSKPLKLKLKVVKTSDSDVLYVPTGRKQRQSSSWVKRDHLRRKKQVDYKRMVTSGPYATTQQDKSSTDTGFTLVENINKLLGIPSVALDDDKSKRDYQKMLETKLRQKLQQEKSKLRLLKKQLKRGQTIISTEEPEVLPTVKDAALLAEEKEVTETAMESLQPKVSANVEGSHSLQKPTCETVQDEFALENEENSVLSIAKEAELLFVEDSDLSVGENLTVSANLQQHCAVKDCQVTMSKLPPLEIVHRDAVHKKEKRGSSQDGDLHFHLYCSENSQCVCCDDCREFFTISDFMLHLHDQSSKDKLIKVTVKQNLELRQSKPSKKEEKLWELFLKKKKILENRDSSNDSAPETRQSKLVSVIENSIAERTRLAAEPVPEDQKETRQSSRVRKRKQLYPIEKYTFSKLLPTSAPIVKEAGYLPNVEFQDTIFSELEPRLLPQEIPHEIRNMPVSPVKRDGSDSVICASVSADIVRKYDLSPRSLVATRFSKRHSKVVTKKNGEAAIPGQYTALGMGDT